MMLQKELMPCTACVWATLTCCTAGINYLQSVTPRLALGGEAFWLGQQRKSGTGFAGRYTGDAFVATAQVATTGLVSLTYVQKISEKVRDIQHAIAELGLKLLVDEQQPRLRAWMLDRW